MDPGVRELPCGIQGEYLFDFRNVNGRLCRFSFGGRSDNPIGNVVDCAVEAVLKQRDQEVKVHKGAALLVLEGAHAQDRQNRGGQEDKQEEEDRPFDVEV